TSGSAAPPPLLSDDWTGTNGAGWDTTKWAATSNDTTKIVDIQGNQGRLYVNGASSRATAQMTPVADSEALLTYQFSDRNAQSNFRVTLRGSGATGGNQLPTGYRVNTRSDSSVVKLEKNV